MSILEDVARMKEVDPGGMHRHLEGFPSQLAEARKIGRESHLSVSGDGVKAVVSLGMGGSAIGGELASGLLADKLPVPFAAVRSYSVPDYVGPDTLAFVSSYSGNTEETLSMYAEAHERGARVVCSTTGGRLSERARADGHTLLEIPGGLPPRAALGYSLVPILVVLARLGLAEDPSGSLEDSVTVAREAVSAFGLSSPAESNPAKGLAQWLRGAIPVVYGTAPRTSVVASRWCGQFSENSKLIGHRNELPEMDHNEIVGWSGGVPLGGLARVVFLRDEEDHPRVARRIEITRASIASAGAGVRDVGGFGGSRLSRLLSLVMLGDFTSFYLAILEGVDPTPVLAIDRLKASLAED